MINDKKKTYLFTAAGRDKLRTLVDNKTLFAFDMDGTLAPIVSDPTAVVVPDLVKSGLEQLGKLAPTAVITGRSCNDARARLGVDVRWLVGNHGAEGLPGHEETGEELKQLVADWQQQLAVLMPKELRSSTLLEIKEYSISLHYRHAPDRSAAHAALLNIINLLQPVPRRVGGKFVENLIPDNAFHKGDALIRLMEHAGCTKAFFLGDDETDEDVFKLNDPRIFSVCVGTDRATAAIYFLNNQEETSLLLSELTVLLKCSKGCGE